MTHKRFVTILAQALVGIMASFSIAQAQPGNPPQGGARGGQFVAMEKQMVLDSISGLNDDQKVIIEAIYQDYEKALTEARAEATGDREAMRTKMTGIRDSKNEALKAALTEDQYKEYEAMMERRRERFQNRQRVNNK